MTTSPLQQRFTDLLERHVVKLTIRGSRATGRCPFHDDRSPSFSADINKNVWYCHACAKGGGVKAFALLVGEEWGFTRSESRIARARRARFQAEQQARAILEGRAEERDKELCVQHREAHAEAVAAADLLAMFWRRPDLAIEFPDLVARTEREYGEALFQCAVLSAQLDGEVA